MKILYNVESGMIFAAVYDADVYKLRHSINVPVTVLEIDEVVGGNQVVCSDLVRTLHRFDANGKSKYYVENGELHMIDGWVEYVEDLFGG